MTNKSLHLYECLNKEYQNSFFDDAGNRVDIFGNLLEKKQNNWGFDVNRNYIDINTGKILYKNPHFNLYSSTESQSSQVFDKHGNAIDKYTGKILTKFSKAKYYFDTGGMYRKSDKKLIFQLLPEDITAEDLPIEEEIEIITRQQPCNHYATVE